MESKNKNISNINLNETYTCLDQYYQFESGDRQTNLIVHTLSLIFKLDKEYTIFLI